MVRKRNGLEESSTWVCGRRIHSCTARVLSLTSHLHSLPSAGPLVGRLWQTQPAAHL